MYWTMLLRMLKPNPSKPPDWETMAAGTPNYLTLELRLKSLKLSGFFMKYKRYSIEPNPERRVNRGGSFWLTVKSVPHAVFTNPQIASIGLSEDQARKDHEILVGRVLYSDTVMGEAMAEQVGFAMGIVEKGTGRILDFHIISPHSVCRIRNGISCGVFP